MPSPSFQQIWDAEQVILKSPKSRIWIEIGDWSLGVEYRSALATLFSATSNCAYRPGPAVIRALGDTGTHEVGHIRNAERTVFRYQGEIPPTGYYIITLEDCFKTLLSATGRGYRPPSGFALDIGGQHGGW